MLKQCRHAAYDEPQLWWRTTLLVSTALALVMVQAVQAQTTTADAPVQPSSVNASAATELSQITVTAPIDPYTSGTAIETKRNLAVVSDGISDVQISRLPEFGLGEALAAIPGVSFVINNGRGEDQFMTVRGLNPDYNTVTIDGMPLPSTQETVRSLSFDVFPAFLISQASVYKTWTVDQPSDAIGSVTNLQTRSAFDHPGPFIVGHLDGGYWTSPQEIRSNVPSGEADLVLSNTFGPSNEFGVLAMVSHYQRSSNTVNTTTSNFAYYPATISPGTPVYGLDQTSKTAIGETLLPSQNVAGMTAVPQTHQWYYYDDLRTRSGGFLRFDYNHGIWSASLSGGFFGNDLNENRDYQYLDGEGPATFETPTTGSYAEGKAGIDYDHYHVVTQAYYVDFNGRADFNADTHLDLNANYGVGYYHAGTQIDSPFTAANSTNLASNFNLAAPGAPLLTPNGGAYMNPSLYTQASYELENDRGLSKLPQIRLDFRHNVDAADMGFGFSTGVAYRDLSQTYSYDQEEWNPIVAPTLATVGTINKTINLYDGEGQTLLLENPAAAAAYVFAHPANYTLNSGDALANQVNNFNLKEAITDGYVQAQYRDKDFLVLLGLREEWTREAVNNFLPSPLSSKTNFVENNTTQSYLKLLPSLNVSYKPVEDVIVRAAVSQNLARAEYGQLAENSSASLTTTGTGGTATETISNPHLMPRESTNYDLSLEYYPAKSVLASVAVFYKNISHEILTLTNTQQNVIIPGYGLPVALTTTESENGTKSSVDGVEFNLVYARFDFLPGLLSGLGARANAAFMSFDAPDIRMSDGTYRHLPQLLSSSKDVVNAAVFYNYRDFHAEVSWNHTSKQPISFDTNNAANDQWWATINTFDAQIGYQITPNLDFRVQVKNLTDATPQKVLGPNQNLNLSLEQNGRAYYAGVAFHY